MKSNDKNQRPAVGVGVLIFKDGRILLGRRKNAHGEGEYAGLGGHLEYMESIEECARREMKEEAGIEADNVRFLCITNLRTYAPKHYIDVGFAADWKEGEPEVREPEKTESWGWYELDNPPSLLFGAVKNYIEAHKTGRRYFDA